MRFSLPKRSPSPPTAEMAVDAVDWLFQNRVISGSETLQLKERIEAMTWTYPLIKK